MLTLRKSDSGKKNNFTLQTYYVNSKVENKSKKTAFKVYC